MEGTLLCTIIKKDLGLTRQLVKLGWSSRVEVRPHSQGEEGGVMTEVRVVTNDYLSYVRFPLTKRRKTTDQMTRLHTGFEF